MAAPEAADLMGIGQHCSVESCMQVDFLPFKCDCCSKVYCLEHRTYAAHQCPASGNKQTEVIVCPLCAKGVKLNGQDPNLAFEEHQRSSGCDPSNWARVNKKPKCPVKGCREKLNTVNTYHCQSCGQRVCLKHRHELDHDCAAAQAASAAQRRQQYTSAPAAFAASLAQQARKLVATTHAAVDPANTLRGSAQRRAQPTSNANPHVPAHLPEVCPQCGARFATVDKLVTHVEEYHSQPQQPQQPQGGGSGWFSQLSNSISTAFNSAAQAVSSAVTAPSFGGGPAGTSGYGSTPHQHTPSTALGHGGGAGGEVFRCPHCRRQFSDAVLLVSHAESCRS